RELHSFPTRRSSDLRTGEGSTPVYDVTAGIETEDGGRRVACRVPLPVAPAVVWDAVATGEGISSWFVPCAMEPQVGGRIVQFAEDRKSTRLNSSHVK